VFTTLTIEGDVHYLAGDREALVATRGVTIAETATLDLQDTDLIVQATPETRQAVLDALAAVVRRARNATPRWSGPGITSGRAATNPFTGLAVVANDDGNGTPLILNHPAYPTGPLNNQMILVRFTYNGDANLDGRVNADDYFRIDSGFLGQPQNPTYAKGDFNYDGKINADDYFLIDSAFLRQSGPLAPPAGSDGSSPLIASASSGTATSSAKKRRRDVFRASWIGAPAGRTRTAHRKRMRLNT